MIPISTLCYQILSLVIVCMHIYYIKAVLHTQWRRQTIQYNTISTFFFITYLLLMPGFIWIYIFWDGNSNYNNTAKCHFPVRQCKFIPGGGLGYTQGYDAIIIIRVETDVFQSPGDHVKAMFKSITWRSYFSLLKPMWIIHLRGVLTSVFWGLC